MSPGVPTRVIAACCGLCGFAVATLAGLSVENPLEDVLIRAVFSLVGCNVLGWIVGAVAEHAVRQSLGDSLAITDLNKLSTSPGPSVPVSRGSSAAS